ncbi:PREDICTED: rho GDP-dissociation inhibitor 1-like [Nicotiana attenuata]|uniref:Rho gdp-dissociation inhibitor 1 n=1 Tax=Nicotiana attenuata TaxID=49451 RepID=A0A1J6IT49_NICAT|nr:PREDICTED: rho GDP-dissociation inhibitor 1-like [Nicotiana attenuata]OIT08389.1 rho gdp-dissociation inhibitor 1 [Nicotiana attenuata]
MMEGGNNKEEAGPSRGLNFNEDKRKEELEEGDSEEDEHNQDPAADIITTSYVPGPLLSLKDQIEKDKEDESLRRWKEKLLGCLESDLNGQMEPEVKFHSVGILSSDFEEINTPLPIKEGQSKSVLFTLKEGSEYRLKLTFSVLHNIVSGLAYTNTVWKAGLQVDQSKGMLGTFAPQREPYIHMLEEETTPSGALARGIYTAKLKFVDDDKRCYLELNYSFEISKGR